MRSWQYIELSDSQNYEIPTGNDPLRIRALQQFRDDGAMDGVFFARSGAAHEDPDDASTWGPQSPDIIDWTGFPAEFVREERGRMVVTHDGHVITVTDGANHACNPNYPNMWAAVGKDQQGTRYRVRFDFSDAEITAAGEHADELPWDAEHVHDVTCID